MALLLVLGTMSAAFAGTPTTDITVNGYVVTKSYITKGTTFNATVEIKDLGHKGNEINDNEIDVSRIADSFNIGGKITVENTNKSGSGPLTAKITIEELTYSGVGNSLELLVGVKGSYQKTVKVAIHECKEYTEPTVEPTPAPTPDPIPTPKVIVTRNELSGDVKAGDELMLTISVKNIGRTTINNPILSFTPSESLLVVGKDSAV